MPRQTQRMSLAPWVGGWNATADPGFLPQQDLVVAENVQFDSSMVRKSRDGIEYLDAPIPAVTHRAADGGTGRTLTFASNINGADDIFVVGEGITVTGAPAGYNVTNTVITAVTANTITYTGDGVVGEATTAETGAVVTKTDTYVYVKDYWYYVPANNAKSQMIVAVSSRGLIFGFNPTTLVRWQVLPDNAARTFASATDVDAGTDTITSAAHGLQTGEYIALTTAGTLPTGLSATNYYVIRTGTNTLKLATSLFNADAGTAVDITATGSGTHTITPATLPPELVTHVTSAVMNETLVIGFRGKAINSGFSKRPKYIVGATSTTLYKQLSASESPDFEMVVEYLSRLWVNDKDNPERLHYSATGYINRFLGVYDSAALDIGLGSGESKGITAIFPPLKSSLFVGKSNEMYRVSGYSPEEFQIETLSKGIGCVGHSTVVQIDQDDSAFWSNRGVHTASSTDAYGAFSANFISEKIKLRFTEDLVRTRLDYTQGTYVPELNSIFWSVAEGSETKQSHLYAYNVQFKEWYKWPNLDVQSVATANFNNRLKLIMGTSDSRLMRAQRGLAYDFTDTPIRYYLSTPALYPGDDLYSMKRFTRLILMYKPKGRFSFTVSAKIDNHAKQSWLFTQESAVAVLGVDFTLGTSVLGAESKLQPYVMSLEGYGHGITLEFEQNSVDESIELYGLYVEWEAADFADEGDADRAE